MHDRTIDGEVHVFGNAGALFMNAMTWYDHKTHSIWSQPWGRAIEGPYKGVELFLLPSQLTTWRSWREEHPGTLLMANDLDSIGFYRQRFSRDFVIGLVLGGESKAYYFDDVSAEGVINDQFGGFPVVLWAGEDNFHAYLRKVDDQVLTFDLAGEYLVDRETESRWGITTGLATEGPLKGQSLQPVPSSSAYDWAWTDFYPESEFYSP